MLSTKLKTKLRGLAHSLKPVVIISAKGVTKSVFEELLIQLEHHELIKIKIRAGDKDRRKEIIEEIVEKTKADLVMATGNVITLYLKSTSKEPKISL